MTDKRFLWNLSYDELNKGLKAFMKATRLTSGSIIGAYNLYDAIRQEWTRAKATVNKKDKSKHLALLCEYAVLDQRSNVVCIRNLEFPTECNPEKCPYLVGVFR